MANNYTAKGGWRHFREKLQERYGFQISHEEWKKLPSQMSNGAGHICNSRNNMAWWCVTTSQGIIFAQYSKKGRYFVSVQPTAMLKAAMKGEGRARTYLGLTNVTPTHRKWYERIYGEKFTEGTRDLGPVLCEDVSPGPTRDQPGEQGSGRRGSRLLVDLVAVARWFKGGWHHLLQLRRGDQSCS